MNNHHGTGPSQWEPGWYPDGQGGERWWDGSGWTEQSRAVPSSQRKQPNRLPFELPKVGVFGTRKALREAEEHRDALSSQVRQQAEAIERFGIADEVERTKQLEKVTTELSEAEAELKRLKDEIEDAKKGLVNVREEIEMQGVGLYRFEHPAEASAHLESELKRLRAAIRSTNKISSAVSANYNFTFNNSKAEGNKMVRAYSKLMLRAYNAEAENCIKTVRAGNLKVAQGRLDKSREQIAKTGEMLGIQIVSDFHRMRLKELELAARHLEAVRADKEAERARRAELREQRKAEQELRREHEKLEKERAHYLNSIEALRAKNDDSGVARLEVELAEIQKALDDVDYRAANIRAGYVYVISNLGAFGDQMVKIGMTRRLDPMDRIRELSDASVPFHFDIHALFFSKDAVGVESMLHQKFASDRVNKVNLRREFFNVKPNDVLEALQQEQVEVLEFEQRQKAPEYRQSWPDVAPELQDL